MSTVLPMRLDFGIFIHPLCLNMLRLYLYTLIIGHKSDNILSILNKLKW